MAFRLWKDIHEGTDVLVFPDDDAGNLGAQDAGEDVVGIVVAVEAHRAAPLVDRPEPSKWRGQGESRRSLAPAEGWAYRFAPESRIVDGQ